MVRNWREGDGFRLWTYVDFDVLLLSWARFRKATLVIFTVLQL